MNKTKIFKYLAIFALLLIPLKVAAKDTELYQHLTKDQQFLIFSPQKELIPEIDNIACHLKEEISQNLNVFFRWETPAQIVIHRQKKWPTAMNSYIYNKPTDEEQPLGLQTFIQDNLEETILFPSITTLILSEIMIRENPQIKGFEGEDLNSPLCLTEGLWRYIAGFDTLENLNQLNSLRLNQILFSDERLTSPILFQIKSTALVNFLLNQPFGKVKFRKTITRLFTKKTSKWIKEIITIYNFKNEQAFNDAWEEYIQALILSLETEERLKNTKAI